MALPPGTATGLEVLDRVALDASDWIVQRIEERGLQRRFELRPARNSWSPARSVSAPMSSPVAILGADPLLKIIDGPALDILEGASVYAIASATPWVAPSTLKMGTALDTLSAVATIPSAGGLGRLEDALGAGPLGRWDEANVIALYMPNESPASSIEELVLSGRNRILIENAAGWELVAWRDATLVSANFWHLSGLLRGLSGSPIRSVELGADAVLVDDRLVPISLSREDFGRTFVTQIDSGEPGSFTFQDKATLPWRVGHLCVRQLDGVAHISWSACGAEYSNNWDVQDALVAPEFVVEFYLGETLLSQATVTETKLNLPDNGADLVRVAAVSAAGRVGEWGSIPLPRA